VKTLSSMNLRHTVGHRAAPLALAALGHGDHALSAWCALVAHWLHPVRHGLAEGHQSGPDCWASA
jgi:hypothetical protein